MIANTAETQFQSQHRWNDVYGRRNLQLFDKDPRRFLVDSAALTSPRSDLLRKLPDLKGKQVMDFGCGRGEFAVALARLGAKVTGVDIGEDLVALSRRVAELNQVSCRFHVAGVDRVPCANGSFDFVVGVGILHHLPRPGVRDALREAYRLCKPGGQALFIEPIENSRIFDLAQNLIPVGKPHLRQYRPSILQRKRWREHMQKADDRAMTNRELIEAKGPFDRVDFEYFGFLVRLARLYPRPVFKQTLTGIDRLLTHRLSPLKRLSQMTLAVYQKA